MPLSSTHLKIRHEQAKTALFDPIDQAVPVSKSSPYNVVTQERERAIFPGPRKYEVKAHVFFFSFLTNPVRYAELISDTITVDVTERQVSNPEV